MIIKKKVQIQSPQGLHARPASLFVRIANKYESDVIIRKDDEQINGKSIMGLLTLAASQGTELELELSGLDAEAAMKELSEFLQMDEEAWHCYDPKDGK